MNSPRKRSRLKRPKIDSEFSDKLFSDLSMYSDTLLEAMPPKKSPTKEKAKLGKLVFPKTIETNKTPNIQDCFMSLFKK